MVKIYFFHLGSIPISHNHLPSLIHIYITHAISMHIILKIESGAETLIFHLAPSKGFDNSGKRAPVGGTWVTTHSQTPPKPIASELYPLVWNGLVSNPGKRGFCSDCGIESSDMELGLGCGIPGKIYGW